MAWTIEFHQDAYKQLAKLATHDRVMAKRITRGLRELGALDDPRSRCEALTGPLGGLWRYRVGDWRVIIDVQRAHCVILAINIDHRSTAYRR